MLIPIGFFGAGGAAGSYELISTTLVTSNTSTVSFTSIAQTYKHLQIRATIRSTYSWIDETKIVLNSDSTSSYSHRLYGTGSSVASNATTNIYGRLNFAASGDSAESNVYAASITDILNYTSNDVLKTLRTFDGLTTSSGSRVAIESNRAVVGAVSQIDFSTINGSIMAGSRFSLYGIKG